MYEYPAVTDQKKGVLDKRDEGKSTSNSTYKPEHPHLPSNRVGDATEVAEGSAQRVWCEQGACCVPHFLSNRVGDATEGTEDFGSNRVGDATEGTEDSHHSAKPEGPFTHSVQQNPHSSTEDAVGRPPPTGGGANPTDTVGAQGTVQIRQRGTHGTG